MFDLLLKRRPDKKVQRVEREVAGLLSELSEIKSMLEDHEQTIEDKEKICLEKRSLIITTQELIVQAKQNLQDKKSKRKELKNEHHQLQTTLFHLTQKLENEDELERKLVQTLEKDRGNLNEVREHVLIREAEVNLKGVQRLALENELQDIQNKITSTQNKIDAMSLEERSLMEQIRELESKRGRVRITLVAKDEKSEDLKRKIQSLQSKISEYELEFSLKNDEFLKVEDDRKQVDELISQKQEQATLLESQIAQMRVQITEVSEILAQSQIQLSVDENKTAALELDVQALEFELQTLRSDQHKLGHQKETLALKYRKMQMVKSELEAELHALISEESSMQLVDGTLAEEINFLRTDIEKFEQCLVDKVQLKDAVEIHLNASRVEHAELQTRRSDLIQTGHELEQLNGRNRKLVDLIQMNIGKRAEEIECLDRELVQLSDEQVRLEDELKQLRGQSQHYKMQMQTKLAHLSELTEEITTKRVALETLQDQTKHVRCEFENYTSQVDEIKQQIFECQNKINLYETYKNDEVQLIQSFEQSLAQEVERKNLELSKLQILYKKLEQARKHVEFARRSQQELEAINLGLRAESENLARQYQSVLTELKAMDHHLGEIRNKRDQLQAEKDFLACELRDAAAVLDRSRQVNGQIQIDLNATSTEIEKSKGELTTVATQIENLQKKEHTLTRLLNAKDDDLNKLHSRISYLRQEEKQTLDLIGELELQTQEMEQLISKMNEEEKTLEESHGRLHRILNGVQKRYEELKATYHAKKDGIEVAKVTARQNIDQIKQNKNAIDDLERKLINPTPAPTRVEEVAQILLGDSDQVDRSQVAQHINAISDFCLSAKINLDFSESWVDELTGDADGALLYHAISMYGKALKVLGATRMELNISKLEQFDNDHFVLSFAPDQVVNLASMKDVFAKSSQIIKTRGQNLAPKLAHKAKVENGRVEKIDIIVKFNLANAAAVHKKDHHPWRSSTSSLM